MKGGKVNDIPAIDLAELAITLGATYVARVSPAIASSSLLWSKAL